MTHDSIVESWKTLLFAVQTTLDLIYLWGGTALPEGMTYAEYAQRGAYPLVVAALLAGAFVLVAIPSTIRVPGDLPGTTINRDYTVLSRAEFRGLKSPAELQVNQRITFRHVLLNGKPSSSNSPREVQS